jgi:uncharacterized phage protein (TIGR02220 family)
MKSIIISLEFFKAIGEKPPYVRIYWVKWLADYTQDLLKDDFVTNFRDDMLKVGKDLNLETIKEAYEFGMPYFKDGFSFIDNSKEKKSYAKEHKELAENVLEYLNQRCETTFTLSKANMECIVARIKEGYTISDFKSVIDKKNRQWFGTEQHKYLRPITLFQAKKFENYLNEAEIENNAKPTKSSSISKLQNAISKAKQFLD